MRNTLIEMGALVSCKQLYYTAIITVKRETMIM